MQIPLVDLGAQYHAIHEEIRKSIRDVLSNCNFILGDGVAEFEKTFAEFCDSKYCIGVASGTDALHLALRALGIGGGDEVITAANTFVATALAISYVGARPVLVDVDPETYNLDLRQIESKITPKTKAIIPVHLYGRPVDMNELMSLAERHNLKVVEDACQAHGATWDGRKVGSFGIMGCFSFYPGKNLGAYGDGGAIVTSDEGLYEKLKMLRNYGSPRKYHHDFIGYNSRLDSIQAAVLNVKLRHLEGWNGKRLTNAKLYNQALDGVGDLVLSNLQGVESHVFHLYVVRTKKRDELLKYLNDNGVQAGIHYPIPIYSLKAYSDLGQTGSDFPVTERLSREILSLPMYSELTGTQIRKVKDVIVKFFEESQS